MVISVCSSGAIPADTAYLRCWAERVVAGVGENEDAGEERRRGGTKAFELKKPLKKNYVNIYTTHNAPSLRRKGC